MRIVDLAFQKREKGRKDSICIEVNYDFSGHNEPMVNTSLVDDGIKLFLTDKENQSLKNICNNSFNVNNGRLAYIMVRENQVEFLPESFRYALIYTKDENKPEIDIEDDTQPKFKKINAHWYQMSLYKDMVFFH